MSAPFVIVDVFSYDLPEPHRRDGCAKCESYDGYLARIVKVNGSVGLRWICSHCETPGTTDLPHALLTSYGVALSTLPKHSDYRCDEGPWCLVCEADNVEFHHWAPRAIFPDWPDLGVYLCFAHHAEWHDRLRAHGLRWPHEIA